jgi:hydrogenase large subunit
MPKTFIPIISNQPAPAPTPSPVQRLAIDPITRIEGHLRLEVQIAGGKVTNAWSSGTQFRGIETILNGRDPREAWLLTQRVCGVCATVHALVSVRAVENALGIIVPDNARIIRNIIEAIQFVQDHVIHFYHLHALDWVDLVSALSADTAAASRLQGKLSDWPNNSAAYFGSVQTRLNTFVQSGQLGLFANAYWGHPAYKLPPEANLVAVSHYLEALDWQRDVIKMQAILGGKNPHPQTYLVGGMAVPLDPASPNAINSQSIAQLKALAAKALDFVTRVYLPDLLMVASYYPEWANLGGGAGNFLSFGDFPQNNSGSNSALYLPAGVVTGKNLGQVAPLDQSKIKEYVARSWYNYPDGNNGSKHPSAGVTQPNYTGPALPYNFLNVDQQYSWLKAPRYNDQTMEVGPLARMVVAYAAGHQRVRQLVDYTLSSLMLGSSALFSTLGRVAARGIETQLIAEQMGYWVSQLEANINAGNLLIHNGQKWDPSTWPAQATGWGATEAPRGALGHWVSIKNGKINNYQMVVPTTWNGSPRDAQGRRGPWEESLIGTPVADPQKPVEILRTIHSYDPCMSCAVHMVDTTGQEITRVQVVEE